MSHLACLHIVPSRPSLHKEPVNMQFKTAAAKKDNVSGSILRRPGDQELVEGISRNILHALANSRPKTGTYMRHINPDTWEFIVLDDPEPNACALPGFLHFVGRDEDKLAAVLGHEIAHVVARHSVERMGRTILLMAAAHLLISWLRHRRARARAQRLEEVQQELQRMHEELARNPYVHQSNPEFRARHAQLQQELRRLQQADRGTGGGDAALQQMFMGLAKSLVELPGSRRNEIEADLVGVRLAKLAGYNPEKAPEIWDQFSAAGMGGGSVMSTHPSSEARSKILVREVALLKENNWSEEAMQSVFHRTGYWSV